tara:strand:- start:346 stop:501 length:156 start_codon:yes stop_codon:yes gene_type:complete
MSLSPHRQHKIYIVATMGFGLDSDDTEEFAYYDMIKNEMAKKNPIGIKRTD